MTGFRVGLGGAQAHYARALPGFAPDLSVFGKVIGGGMPLAAFGGKRDVMEQLAPLGPVYPAGTLSGNPVATACGLATLREIARPPASSTPSPHAPARWSPALSPPPMPPAWRCAATAKAGCSASSSPMPLPQRYAEVMATDSARFNRFFHAMLERGVYLAPALYEAGFVSSAHGESEIAATLAAARDSLAA